MSTMVEIPTVGEAWLFKTWNESGEVLHLYHPVSDSWKDERFGLYREGNAKPFRENITLRDLPTALTFAHAKKRRFIVREGLDVAILACLNCHNIIERLPHTEMERIVLETIATRGTT